jgi:glycosyltransferase involved in cell wall biosynthesis
MSRFAGEAGLIKLADVTLHDVDANARAIAKGQADGPHKHDVATWFLPVVTHALKGGVRTIFMLAEDFTRTWGCLNIIVLCPSNGRDVDTSTLARSLKRHFPEMDFLLFVHRPGKDDLARIPDSDFAFCSLWTTAYVLLIYNRTKAKYYLMQDYEPSFYAAGSVSGVIEQTYRLGFSCIANTPGVGDRYRTYSDDVVSFKPGVDRAMFHEDVRKTAPGKPARVVFYGRPSNPRNCFSLGLEVLRALKQRMGSSVVIQSVGEEWSPEEYGLQGIVENLGLLDSLEAVAALYRTADVGMVFMMTPHPSYQPLEYMASGCVVATNINESNQWLLGDHNALLLEPLPEIAAKRLEDVLTDARRWSSLRAGGLMSISKLSWESAFSIVRQRIRGN